MIVDTKAIQLFPVEMHRIVTDLDHKAITEYTLEHRKTWKGYTTYHDQEIIVSGWKDCLIEINYRNVW